ncbi:MAG TPA: hypothetical protein VNI56_03865 [Xanthomonadaceae bacterium]|nr:hypothetical protein [Xanthomonadaceae bacterium]
MAAILALLWTLMGVASYLFHVTLSPEAIAALPAGQARLMNMTPAWVNGAFAIATWSGLLGAIGLLLRRRWARGLFVLSLIALLIQFGWVFLVARGHELMGPSSALFPAIIAALGIILIWFASDAAKRGWLR